MNERELLKIKKEIDTAKTEVSELEGSKKTMLKDLLDRFGCKTLEEASTKLEKMTAEIEALQAQLDDGLREIEKKYGEIEG
jgi:uncharacterized phage infection (PIP) family protein YhgE